MIPQTDQPSNYHEPSSHPEPASNTNHVHSEALSQLSKQLISTGFLRQELPPTTFDGGSIDGQKLLMKAIWSILSSRSKEMTIREDLLAKQRELLYEHTRLEGFLQRAEKEKLEAQQEATASTNRANAAQKELESEKARHRKTKEDYAKLKNAEKLIKTTSIHELRKKTNELDEIQRRMTKLADNKHSTLSSSLNWSSSGPLTTRVDTDGGGRAGLLEFDLKASREQNNQLLVENSRLRDYIGLYEQQLIDLISEINNHPQLFENSDFGFLEEEDDQVAKGSGLISTNSNGSIPLSKIYHRLSSVTYKLRDRVLEILKLVEELQTKIIAITSSAEKEKIEFQEEHKKLRAEFQKEIEMLQLSLKGAEATIEGWALADFTHGRNLDGMDDVMFEESLDNIPKSKVPMAFETAYTEKKNSALEAIAIAKQKAEMDIRKMNEERQRILQELDLNPTPKPSGSGTGTSKAMDERKSTTDHKAEGDQTLESLVVYTKPSTTSKKKPMPVRTGKARSSISKGFGTDHRVKQPSRLAPTSSRPATTRNRTAVLTSLLSITGEKGKPTENTATAGATSTNPSSKTESSTTAKSQNQASSSSSSRLPNPSSLARSRVDLKKPTSRIIRPTQRHR